MAQGPVQLVAMADVIESRMNSSHTALSEMFPKNVDVPPERRFVGFDAYRKAIDCLGPGDVAMLTGYAGFRPVQLEYAVAKGVNVFMEKSFAVDPPAARRVIQAGEEAGKKNLKIAAGLMCRHSVNRQELIKQIRDGVLGDIQLIRAYRMGPVGPLGPKPPAEDELLWQFRNFFRFLWVSGGLFAEMDIHQIDEICWLKDALPVQAHGIGGRAADSSDCSQNLDSFAIEWTFADGTKATDVVRYLAGCHNEFATYVHGTKCAAQFSGDIHAGTVQRYRDQRIAKNNVDWKARRETHSVAGGVGRLVRRHSQRPSAQRGTARCGIEPGRHDGPGCRARRADRYLGRRDELELPVLPEHRPDGLQHAASAAAGRSGTLPGARAGCVDRDLTDRLGNRPQVFQRAGERQSAFGRDERQARLEHRADLLLHLLDRAAE